MKAGRQGEFPLNFLPVFPHFMSILLAFQRVLRSSDARAARASVTETFLSSARHGSTRARAGRRSRRRRACYPLAMPAGEAVTLSRRRLLLGLAALASPSCRCASTPPAPPDAGSWKELSFEPGAGDEGPQRALLLAAPSSEPLPLLVALHGRGEAVRGLDVGARGWRDDYHLDDLLLRIQAPPLTADDLGRMVHRERLFADGSPIEIHAAGAKDFTAAAMSSVL